MQQFIVLASPDGVVDMTPQAIAARTSFPLDLILKGIKILSEPDPYTRTPGEEGRRIVLIDDHRPWGWRIVNHGKYMRLRDMKQKREADRQRMSEKRGGLPKEKPTGYVYFAATGESGPIKIGFSRNPWARATELQTGSAKEIKVICAIPGKHADEADFHREFAESRIPGSEWFNRTATLVVRIDELKASKNNSVAIDENYVANVAHLDSDIDVKEAAAKDAALDPIWGEGLQILLQVGIPENQARSFIGLQLASWFPMDVLEALQAAAGKADPRSYVRGVLRSRPKKGESSIRVDV